MFFLTTVLLHLIGALFFAVVIYITVKTVKSNPDAHYVTIDNGVSGIGIIEIDQGFYENDDRHERLKHVYAVFSDTEGILHRSHVANMTIRSGLFSGEIPCVFRKWGPRLYLYQDDEVRITYDPADFDTVVVTDKKIKF